MDRVQLAEFDPKVTSRATAILRMDPKEKAVLERMKSHEYALAKAKEYLETGAHSNWPGFRALFAPKTKDGREMPPHKDWVRNVFIPSHEKAIRKAERILERLEQKR